MQSKDAQFISNFLALPFTSSCYVTDVLSKNNFLRPGIYGELYTFLTIIIIVPGQ